MSWPAKNDVYVRVRVARGQYKCEACDGIFKKDELDIDHIQPVIDPTDGFIDWNTYISRLFCEADGMQALCKSCHAAKTIIEEELRSEAGTWKHKKDLDKAE